MRFALLFSGYLQLQGSANSTNTIALFNTSVVQGSGVSVRRVPAAASCLKSACKPQKASQRANNLQNTLTATRNLPSPPPPPFLSFRTSTH